MDQQPWTDSARWCTYLDNTDECLPAEVDPDAVFDLSEELRLEYRGHGQALAVAGLEPTLSATVAAAVRANWQEAPARRRPPRYPVWWGAPAGLRLDRVARALAEHLGSPVVRGHNPSSWVSHLLHEQRVPVAVLSGLGNLPVARAEHHSLPRLLAYLVKSTDTLFVFVDPDPERILFDVPAGLELASRTALITIPRPDPAEVAPFPERRDVDDCEGRLGLR